MLMTLVFVITSTTWNSLFFYFELAGVLALRDNPTFSSLIKKRLSVEFEE
jgi:hypothetical protein